MTRIDLIVNGAQVKASVNGVLTGGMTGVRVHIRYDSRWNGLIKTLVCKSNVSNELCNVVRCVLDVDAESTVAHEVMVAGRRLYLGIEGRTADGTEVYPTCWVDCGLIHDGANANADPTTQPTPDTWEQIQQQMGSLHKLDTDNKSSLVAAINEAMTKGGGIKGDPGYTPVKGVDYFDGEPGDDGYTPIKGVDYWTEEDQEAILDQCEDWIADAMAQRAQIEPEFANSIEECLDTTKLYVLPDGYIYAYAKSITDCPEIVIEEQADAYYNKNGSITSGEGFASKNTNIIPVTPGDVLTYTGKGRWNVPSVLWYQADGSVLSYEQHADTVNNKITTATVTAPEGATGVRFVSFEGGTSFEKIDLDVSWVYCYASEHSSTWVNTGHAFVPADYEDRIVVMEEKVEDLSNGVTEPLYNKKIVYDGDSICYGAGYRGGYARIIGELTAGTYVNQAEGGARLVTRGSHSWHSVVDNLPNLPTDGDLYCFEGGINDYWTSGMILGTFSNTDYKGELDKTTVCGALEAIFRYALDHFVGKPICFVITHKIQETAFKTNSSGNTFQEYRDAMVGICRKYSIPYYDAFTESGLNGWNDAHNDAFFTEGDGCHPNVEGYRRYYVPQLLDLFRRIIRHNGTESILYFDAIRKYLDDSFNTEEWTFELGDGSVVTKQVVLK